MKKLIILILFAAFSPVKISAEEIPAGVVYKYASDELNGRIKGRLERVLRTRSSLEELPENWDNKNNIVVIGKNLGDRIFENNLDNPFKTFHYINLTIPVQEAEVLRIANYGIIKPEQLKVFSDCFWKEIEIDSDFKVRKLTSDEIALVWALIGWDLDEPVFVVDDQDHTLVFDFTASGEQLDWIEDIKDVVFDMPVYGKTVKVKPHMLGEGKDKHVVFTGAADEMFFVIE